MRLRLAIVTLPALLMLTACTGNVEPGVNVVVNVAEVRPDGTNGTWQTGLALRASRISEGALASLSGRQLPLAILVETTTVRGREVQPDPTKSRRLRVPMTHTIEQSYRIYPNRLVRVTPEGEVDVIVTTPSDPRIWELAIRKIHDSWRESAEAAGFIPPKT